MTEAEMYHARIVKLAIPHNENAFKPQEIAQCLLASYHAVCDGYLLSGDYAMLTHFMMKNQEHHAM
jgi:hypothetical protein